MPRDRSADSRIHDYTPVNKYIDEQARIRRTKSVWGYTRSIALFLAALGIFLLLLALAYWIFNKPHNQANNLTQIEIDNEQEEVSEEDIENSQDEIERAKEEIEKIEEKNESEKIAAENAIYIFEEDNEKLKDERDILKEQVNDPEITTEERQELTDKIVDLDKKINKNNDTLDKERGIIKELEAKDNNQNLQKQYVELIEKNKELERKYADQESDTLKEDTKELLDETNSEFNEIEKFQDDLAKEKEIADIERLQEIESIDKNLNIEKEKIQEEINEVENDIQSAEDKFEQADEDLSNVQKQLQGLDEKIKQQEELDKEIENQEAIIQSTETTKEAIEKDIQELTEKKNKVFTENELDTNSKILEDLVETEVENQKIIETESDNIETLKEQILKDTKQMVLKEEETNEAIKKKDGNIKKLKREMEKTITDEEQALFEEKVI